ncbi:hypothetical protein OKW18_006680 [Streptomyces pratensis]|nr:hypothetical protein [Streptomyces pratensis]
MAVGAVLERQLRPVTDDLTGHLIEGCGHIIPLHRPHALLEPLIRSWRATAFSVTPVVRPAHLDLTVVRTGLDEPRHGPGPPHSGALSVAAARIYGGEQMLNGRVYVHDHNDPNPGPLPHRTYAELVGGPLGGLLLDTGGGPWKLTTELLWPPSSGGSPGGRVPRTGRTPRRLPGAHPGADHPDHHAPLLAHAVRTGPCGGPYRARARPRHPRRPRGIAMPDDTPTPGAISDLEKNRASWTGCAGRSDRPNRKSRKPRNRHAASGHEPRWRSRSSRSAPRPPHCSTAEAAPPTRTKSA